MEFIHDPREAETRGRVDPETNELVIYCTLCGAEARHRPEELDNFHFQHRPWCPVLTGIPGGEA